MPSLDPHHAVLRRQWAQESQALERRRLCLQAAARTVALVLKERWPQLEDVWLFGSAATPKGLRRHSDLDLALAGLPAEAQIAALEMVEQQVDGTLAAAGEPGIAIDLVRLEDLEPHWQRRIRERAYRLT